VEVVKEKMSLNCNQIRLWLGVNISPFKKSQLILCREIIAVLRHLPTLQKYTLWTECTILSAEHGGSRL